MSNTSDQGSRITFISELIFLVAPTVIIHTIFFTTMISDLISTTMDVYGLNGYGPIQTERMDRLLWPVFLPSLITGLCWFVAWIKFGKAAWAFLRRGRIGLQGKEPSIRSGFLWSIPLLPFIIHQSWPIIQALAEHVEKLSLGMFIAAVSAFGFPALFLSGLGILIPALHLWFMARQADRTAPV